MPNSGSAHFGDESLELYAFGRLEEPELGKLEEHLLLCEHCQVRLDQSEQFMMAMKSAAANYKEPTAVWPRVAEWFAFPKPVWIGAAAAFACVILAVLVSVNPGSAPAPAVVHLAALRGANPTVAAGHSLILDLDATGLAPTQYRLQLVDNNGRTLWESTATATSEKIQAKVPQRIQAGNYFIRIYAPGSADPLREFSLQAVK